jgi:hypothetical protein
MTGALLQLVAYGKDDIYLTYEPQITFFRVVYRRHTNFTIEPIKQLFDNIPDFGKVTSAVISKSADLVGQIYIVVNLPKIKQTTDTNTVFAWVKRIGFALIKNVQVEINGRIIDSQFGEWLNIWAELTGQINSNHKRGLKKLIGDVPENTNFTSTKNAYTLYIPLQFWFCRSSGNALPLVSFVYCDVKINVEFQEANKCYMYGPSHYIQCMDDIVNFTPYEYIEQNIDGQLNAGIFLNYDINSKRLYYYKLTQNKLQSIPTTSQFINTATSSDINNLITSPFGLKYSIIGKTSNYNTFAELGSNSVTYPSPTLRNISITDAYLIVEYYFLDEDERFKFSQAKHDYLIEQVFYTPNVEISASNFPCSIISEHPCKLMVWVVQLQYIENCNDHFNYSTSYQNKLFSYEPYPGDIGSPAQSSLILGQTIFMNGNERFSLGPTNGYYFDSLQKIMHTSTIGLPGINMYAFGLFPFINQPSGSCNTTQIDNIQISLNLVKNINILNKANLRCYCLCNNVLRVAGGLTGEVFLR